MSDSTSGQNAEQWKQKYYDQLDHLDQKEKEWSELESLLKRTIGRLSLAAEGHHKTLDRHIQDIRAAVKDNVNRHRLESILDDLSSLLTKIEEKQKAPNRQTIMALHRLVEQLSLPAGYEKSRKKILKQLAKSDDDDSETVIRDILGLLQQSVNQAEQHSDKKTGLIGRLLGTASDTTQKPDLAIAIEVAVEIINMLPWAASHKTDIASLIDHVRTSRDAQAISKHLQQLEKLIASWNQDTGGKTVARARPATAVAAFVCDLNSRIDWPEDRLAAVKAFEHRIHNEPEALEDLVSQYASLINALQAGTSTQPVGEDVQLQAYRSCMLSILDKLDTSATPDGRIAAIRLSAMGAGEKNELEKLTHDLAAMLGKTGQQHSIPDIVEHDSEQPRIQELLIRLLEQLVVPVDLHGEVEAMKTRLESEKEPADWKQLLKDVALLINSIRSRMQQEKHEFEDFLQQITNRLKELDSFLQTETDTWKQAEEDGRAFDSQVNSQVQDIREGMVQAVDLQQLKSVVENRLDVISQHILSYRNTEARRYAEAQKNAEVMQSRMQTLEQETEKLKVVIIEKNKQALSDTLTGIPNRLAFEQRVEVEIARWKRFSHPLSLAMWDVDFFKKVNDTYGHKAGDKVLRTIAQLLGKRIRQTDFIARYGGEEFVMLLPGTKEEETLRLVNELRKQVEECGFHYHGKAVTITVSCGVSSFRANDSLEQVFERADKALYKAKKNGRNQCVIASVRSD